MRRATKEAAPPVPAKRLVSAGEVRRRLQSVEHLMRQGWPLERIVDGMRSNPDFRIGPKAVARLVERVKQKWLAEASTPLGVRQQRELAQIDEEIRRLHTEFDPDTKTVVEIRDPAKLDMANIERLMRLRADISGSKRAEPDDAPPIATATRQHASPTYLGCTTDTPGADAADLQGDQGEDEEEKTP